MKKTNKTLTQKLLKVRQEIAATKRLAKDLQTKARILDQHSQNLLNHYRDLDTRLQKYEKPAEQ